MGVKEKDEVGAARSGIL